MNNKTDKHVIIGVDPICDLYAAGHDIDEAANFTSAYRTAAEQLLDGIADVTVARNDGGTDRLGETGADIEIVEGGNLWQTVHDCIDRTDDGRWIVLPDAVDAARMRLLRAIAAHLADD